ncbi:molybdenum cofactor biosynthesis protein B [Duganella sp. 1224]|uniref:molybdenum cofactor synthesis domain-containing protein n=1 Tax=Duganella sp. 1224 TaxID=2587052 RepID=UPI00180FAE3D|nr:molybdenum cofactor synthesis domain-containing protein [Duganella sp. 1224]NYE60667.1 molybdenum cofactor biosynthesis protein B [Duganella sp. 1224]
MLTCAVITVSNTRTAADDDAGDLLATCLQEAGHRVLRREIVFDNRYQLRRAFSECIADPQIDVVISSGGTGFARHNAVPEAVEVLFDQPVPGFGELFRQLSFNEIGAAAIQSRCVAGIANDTLVFCLPGSPGACALAWNQILRPQLDHSTRPCNFACRG